MDHSPEYRAKSRRSFKPELEREPSTAAKRVYRLDDGDLRVRDVVNLINLHQQNQRWWKRFARWVRRARS